MADSPWGARFAGLKIVKEVNIQALSSVSDGSQEKSVGERVELTALDQSPFLLFIAFTHYLVFQHAVPEDKFVQACQIIAEIWPVLTGRSLAVSFDLFDPSPVQYCHVPRILESNLRQWHRQTFSQKSALYTQGACGIARLLKADNIKEVYHITWRAHCML